MSYLSETLFQSTNDERRKDDLNISRQQIIDERELQRQRRIDQRDDQKKRMEMIESQMDKYQQLSRDATFSKDRQDEFLNKFLKLEQSYFYLTDELLSKNDS